MDDQWTKVSHKKNKLQKEHGEESNSVCFLERDRGHSYLKNHSVIPKQSIRPIEVVGNTVVKKANAGKNKQEKSAVNIRRIEKNAEEGELTFEKISHKVALQVQQARQDAGMNQKELAQKCNLPLFEIVSIEKAEAPKNASTKTKLNKISAILSLKINSL